MPVLITVIPAANQPRPPAAKRVMRYKRARAPAEIAAQLKAEMPEASEEALASELARRVDALCAQGLLIEQWDLDRIGADLSRCGMAGSPTKVFRIQSIVLKREGYVQVPATEEGIRQLVRELVVDRILG